MRKTLLTLLTFFILCPMVFGIGLMKMGDNLPEYLKKNPVKYQIQLNPISDWAEGKATAYSYSNNTDGNSPIIIFVNDDSPIGVLQGKEPKAYYLLDLDGDGNLDTKTVNIILPYWVVSKNSSNKTDYDNITGIMEEMYQGFQSDDGPMLAIMNTMQTINSYKNDIKLENRDLVYLLYYYDTYNQLLPSQALLAITHLSDVLKSRFNKQHPLTYLYTLETYISLQEKEKARETLKILRNMDQKFIPAMVYEYQLEPDKEKAKVLLANLKKNHGNHWIVKRLL